MLQIDHTHSPEATTWVPGADEHPDFPVQNIPFGVFSLGDGEPRIGTAVGDYILDLSGLVATERLPPRLTHSLGQRTLNALFALPARDRLTARHAIFQLLTSDSNRDLEQRYLYPATSCSMHLPFDVGDFTDFYAGIHHANNIGRQFRPDNPLFPNYKFVPIAYHGRASSVMISGSDVIRPKGQLKPPDHERPIYARTEKLDYEVELGIWISGTNKLGDAVAIGDCADRIGGYCLLNDWSARDIQAWEYQPLGPFLAKSFMTSVSAWVVTREALAPFGLPQNPRAIGSPDILPHLFDDDDQASGALSVSVETWIRTPVMQAEGIPAHRLGSVRADNLYWTPAQMVAHHTSNGCNLQAGDLLGTGTISGSERDSLGSLMELAVGGASPIILPTGEVRSFLEDGDEITLSAVAERPGFRDIGFGNCIGKVVGAIPLPSVGVAGSSLSCR